MALSYEEDGFTELHLASKTGNINAVRELINQRFGLNAREFSKGCTALHVAVVFEQSKIIKVLLEKGADFTLRNDDGETPLHIAYNRRCKRRCANAIKLILNAYYTCCSKINENIRKALAEKNIPTVANMNVSAKFLQNFKPLHFAVEFQELDIMTILIENKIDIQAKDSKGMTALHCAVQDSQMGLLEKDYLHYRLYKFTKEEKNERSLFHEKLLVIVNLLLKHGCDINAIDNFGRSPVFYLYNRIRLIAGFEKQDFFNRLDFPRISSARKVIISRLLSFSPNLHVKDYKGNTILHLMAQAGNEVIEVEVDMATEHLNTGGDVNALNNAGFTPLYYACASGNKEMFNVLMSNSDVDVNLTRSKGLERPIHAAVTFRERHSQFDFDKVRGDTDMVQQLYRRGAYLDATTSNGVTPVLWASNKMAEHSWNIWTFQLLLNLGCDINCVDGEGKTPLHYVCQYEDLGKMWSPDCLEYGADVNVVDCRGNTPFSDYIKSRTRYSNFSEIRPFFRHFKRLQMLGAPICLTNREVCENVKARFEKTTNFGIPTDEECRAELNSMRAVHIDGYTTLYSMLHKSANDLIHYLRNERLSNILSDFSFKINYPLYGSLLKNKFTFSKSREALINPAMESLNAIVKIDMPEACFHEILSYLRNSDLINLIEL